MDHAVNKNYPGKAFFEDEPVGMLLTVGSPPFFIWVDDLGRCPALEPRGMEHPLETRIYDSELAEILSGFRAACVRCR
jgi:hypothetical protein